MSTTPRKRKDRPGVDRAGRTPLHYACVDRQTQVAKNLIATGMDVNQADDDGITPLHLAAQQSDASTVTVLLAHRAQVDAVDVHGNSPLWKAVFNSRGDGEVIRLLRSAGANPGLKNNHGVAPLDLARGIANYDIAQFFSDLP